MFKTIYDGTKKARFVANGFQRPFKARSSHTIQCLLGAFRLSQGTTNNWKIKQIVVLTIFLNSILGYEVYIKKLQGVESKGEFFI